MREELQSQRFQTRGVGGDAVNPWIDRGPNNIGGRTRGIMFDPNDADNNRVFAGGVSGGLWVNEDVTDPNSSWTLVPGIGANISVITIIYDPNDTDTFYIGSGESYTQGRAVGRGIWKSTDGGVTWSNIFGGPDDNITQQNGFQVVDGIFYVNDIVARNVSGSTELYASIAGQLYRDAFSDQQVLGLEEQGLYRSTDGGSNWTKITIEVGGSPINPNDLEIDLNNNVWLTTTNDVFGNLGGRIYRSMDGTSFTLMRTLSGGERTELAVSNFDADKLWVAVDVSGQADLFITTNAFTTITRLSEPNDADEDISATDYTRGQADYDLPIEVDANDNVYVGGIDLFRSVDEGSSWTQISKWSNNPGLDVLNVPLVHADHHAIVFRPGAGNENQALFGTDGGIYYTPDATLAQGSLDITPRNKDYNVTQFYYGSIGPSDTDEILYGGTQDNGTIISQSSTAGANSFDNYFAFFSGDGSYSEIDDNGGLTGFGNGEYMIVGSVFVNYRVASPSVTSTNDAFNNGYDIHTSGNTEGSFINPAELDEVGNILYANSSTSATNRISRYTLGAASATESFITSPLLNDRPTAFKVSPFNNSLLLAGTRSGRLLRVANANSSPVVTNISGPSFVGSISDIEYGENDQEIFVTMHNYGVTNIWFTNNAGSTWTSIEGDLPDLPVKCILQNPLLPQELIIGTELGVWRTPDYLATNVEWTQSFNGMSDVVVVDLDLRASDNTILATTHGRGLFTSNFTAIPASVDEVLAEKKAFSVYPTISNGDFTVFAKSDLGNSQISIFDINGKQVYNSTIDFNKNQNQNLSVNLRSGIYIVNILDQNKRRSSEKIIIK